MLAGWCCAFLALRLHALVLSLLFVYGGSVCECDMGGSLLVLVVPLVCLAGSVDVCDVGDGGSMVGASGWSCCVYGRFVRFCARFCSTRSVPSAL